LDPSNGQHVSGGVHPEDVADAAAGGLVAVVTDSSGQEIGRCEVEADGTFDCELPGLEHNQTVHVVVVDQAGNGSERAEALVDAVAPVSQPTPSDGEAMSGRGEAPGDGIVVRDSAGEELCATTVQDDLTWTCQLRPAAQEGDKVVVEETDPALNVTRTDWRIGLPRLKIGKPGLAPGETQTVTGENFQPGEAVAAVMRSDPLEIGTATADSEGRAAFTWTVPAATAAGQHQVELSGPLSGQVAGGFLVVPQLPVTGASGLVALLGAAAALALAGGLMILAAWRRRRRDA
jgi:adhesin/invasin